MNKGQTIVEYVVIIGVVITALYAMGPALKRSMQTVVKASADQLGVQNAADQDFSPDGSHLGAARTGFRVSSNRSVAETGGVTTTTALETTVVNSMSSTTLGFSQ